MSLTVTCVLVRGHVDFTPEYVTRLRSMARRTLPAHRFVCFTDQKELLPGVECVDVTRPRGCFAWWAKLNLFDPRNGLTGRCVYFDLDTLLLKNLEPIYERSDFALAPDGAPNFRPRDGREVVKRFNSSVMSWDAGLWSGLYSSWTPRVAEKFWGDQDWIGWMHPEATALPAEWFPRLSAARPPWPDDAKVVLCKKPKNAEAARKWSWFEKEWA